MADVRVVHGDCLAVLRSLPDDSVDSVVTDPPYGLADHRPAELITALTAWVNGDRERVPDGRGFMGKSWDAFVPPPAVWDECLRVLKPGGHLVAFAGSRTYDLMGLSVRLAGFEIRDGLQWLYGSGFPKGQDVGKAIDATLLHGGANSRRIKAANRGREVVGEKVYGGGHLASRVHQSETTNGVMGTVRDVETDRHNLTAPATPDAAHWQGWNTSLKPAHEPIVLARKPLSGTVAATVLEHGTGALNVDGCRVASSDALVRPAILRTDNEVLGKGLGVGVQEEPAGRWPANVLLSHGPECVIDDPPVDRRIDLSGCAPGCPVAVLNGQSGTTTSPPVGSVTLTRGRHSTSMAGALRNDFPQSNGHGDSGGASRFFPSFRYQAKAPTSERPKVDGVAHPTVKPVALMSWLIRLVTPPGGTVLDPFAGSGTTLQAARDEGMASIGIERDPTYLPLIAARLGLELDAIEHHGADPAPALEAPSPTSPVPPDEQDETMALENADASAPRNPGGKRKDDFADFDRDQYGRPKIIRAELMPSGHWVVPRDPDGKPIKELVSFTRASTLGGAIEYQGGLHRWKAAVALWGAFKSRTLGKRVRALSGYSKRADKDELYEVIDKATALAEADEKADHGTALHSIFQRIAEGETVDQLITSGAIDPDDVPACRAFADAITRFDVKFCERRVVCDEAQAAGKYDIVVTPRRPMPIVNKAGDIVGIAMPGDLITVDNKTSATADYFGEKFAVQLWIYAHGRDYNPETGERTEVGVRKDWALILHIPSGTGVDEDGVIDESAGSATWHWVDLSIGGQLVKTARSVLEGRRIGKHAIITADLDREIPAELLAAEVARREEAAYLDQLPDGACSACEQAHPLDIPCPDPAPAEPLPDALAVEIPAGDAEVAGYSAPAMGEDRAAEEIARVERRQADAAFDALGADLDQAAVTTEELTESLERRTAPTATFSPMAAETVIHFPDDRPAPAPSTLGPDLQRAATRNILVGRLKAASTVAELADLYRRAFGAGFWDEGLNEIAGARRRELQSVPA